MHGQDATLTLTLTLTGELHGGVVGSYRVSRMQQLLDALQLQSYGGLVTLNLTATLSLTL